MPLLPILLLLQTAPAGAAPQDTPIIVTARPFAQTAADLAACIARECPPDEEVRAALAHAENLFVAGDYRSARLTMRRTLHRVDKAAKTYPVAVADAWRADARIAAHLGEEAAMRIGQLESVDALKAGLRPDDSRVILQRLEVADTFLKQGRYEVARNRFLQIAEQARATGEHGLRGMALLRVAMLYTSLADLDTVFRQQQEEALARLRATTEPELANFREAAELIAARSAATRGDLSTIDRVAARYAASPTARPMLLFAPRPDYRGTMLQHLTASPLQRDETEMRRTAWSPGDFRDQWIDVTFLIDADGRVRDAEVLRESDGLRIDDWTKPLLASISGRRYAPLRLSPGTEGLRRVERYTVTSFKEAMTGTRMESPTVPRLEMTDLSVEPSPASPASKG